MYWPQLGHFVVAVSLLSILGVNCGLTFSGKVGAEMVGFTRFDGIDEG